jgi:hypothetical protein
LTVTGRAAVGPRIRSVRKIRRNRRGISGKIVVISIVLVVAILALLFVPIPGYYNVQVATTISETCIIFCSYSVQSVNPTVTGSSTIFDIGLIFPGANIAAPCLNCQYKVTASLSDGQSSSGSESKFISNLLNFNYQDTVTLLIGYVPASSYGVQVTVTLNGQTIATGSGSITVGG